MQIKNKELLNIVGGAINATMINAAARILSIVIDIGKMVGTALRRAFTKNVCRAR